MKEINDYNLMDIIEYTKDNFLVINTKNKIIELSGNIVKIINGEYAIKFSFEEVLKYICNEFINKVKVEFYDGVINRKAIEVEFQICSNKYEKRWVSLKVKPFISPDGTLQYFYGYIHDVSKEKEAEEILNNLMEFDSLTKLPSRYYVKNIVNEKLLYRESSNSGGILILVNIDNFKVINDSFGYKEGDTLLLNIATKLLNLADEDELICRYSGDEFIIFNSNINSIDEVKDIVNKIKSIFNKPFTIKGSSMYITASIGISIFPENGDNFNDLLKNADLAMYRVKSNGKDGYELFDNNMNTKNLERALSIQKELKNALEKEELYVVFQPKVMLESSVVIGFEALIRWNSDILGFVGPNEFIPIAESTRLIIPIGRFVLEEVFKKVRTLLDEGFDNFKIAVNFSEVQFRYGTILEDFNRFAKMYEVSPKYIEVEITETILMKSFKENIDKLQAIRELGVTVALDDFGTGYSCFSYLTKLPIDVLKIDRSFIIDLLENHKSKCVIENIINLSHSLGIDVVAEGVEEAEQVEYLKEVLCDLVQGYYFSEPKKFEYAKELLGKKI